MVKQRKVYMSKERREFIRKDVERSKDQPLPFEIGGKPIKPLKRDISFVCPNCKNTIYVSKFTYMVECSACRSLVKVER